jgi:hypothetical protein
MKFKESDTGNELHYARFPGIELEEVGDWCEDRNNIAPCEWTMCNAEYVKWFISTHPTPVDVRQATRFWLDRREQLWRRQHRAPGSYEEFLQRNTVGPIAENYCCFIKAENYYPSLSKSPTKGSNFPFSAARIEIIFNTLSSASAECSFSTQSSRSRNKLMHLHFKQQQH